MRFLAKWLPRRNQNADLEEELRSHIAIESARLREEGFAPEQAEQIARASFGNVTQVKEDVRETWGWPAVERSLDDLRFGLRLLRKTPVWTFTVSATLALGTGIAAAIFSVVYSVLLAPLPYQDPQRIVALQPTTVQPIREAFQPNPALWKHWQRTLRSVEDIALTRPVANFNLTGDGVPERLQGARITFNLPRILGVQPLYGRAFTEAEQLAGARVVMLSHRLWTRRFGADPSVTGRKILLNGEPHEIAGVMPPAFQFPNGTFELWAPLYLPSHEFGHGYNYGLICTGRLKSGVSMEQAQAELSAVMRALSREHPASYGTGDDWTDAMLQPLGENQAAASRPILIVLSAAVACLLAIGCMNLAVLLIARSSARSREVLVRVALGASRSRLRRQFLAEAIPLGLLGAAGSIAFAHVFLQGLVSLLPATFPRIDAIGLNGPVLGFAVFSSLGIVIAAGMLPSRISSGMQLASALQQNSRSVAPGNRIRDALVIAQVAVAVPLLLGGLLFARSFAALLNVRPGFDANT
ncbi:MAG: ABC transporter permease, partial [Bryobacterales bacterium]|nr:ABC transporter permease [Bryobacterales bacterium]